LPSARQINPISIINGEINKEELMFALSLKNSRNFRQRYLPVSCFVMLNNSHPDVRKLDSQQVDN
jgi:hypothetical protein